jgi:type IV pilus assembly protein PilP
VLALLPAAAPTRRTAGWMDQQRREVKPNVPPLTAPKKFDPAALLAAQAVDPFSNQKLTVALKQEAGSRIRCWPRS